MRKSERKTQRPDVCYLAVIVSAKPFWLYSSATRTEVEKMAFESGARLHPCMLCGQEFPYFKLMQNNRSRVKDPMTYEESTGSAAPSGSKSAGRVCSECEVRLRREDWEQMTDKQKEDAGEDYCSETRVRKDMKSINKGTYWNETSKSLVQAREEIKDEERESGGKASKKQRNKMILAQAQNSAEALVALLNQSIPVWQAFEAAGDRMFKNSKAWDQLQVAYNKYETSTRVKRTCGKWKSWKRRGRSPESTQRCGRRKTSRLRT